MVDPINLGFNIPTYGIKDPLMVQETAAGSKGIESPLPALPIVSDSENDDALFLDCEDPDAIEESDDVEYFDALEEQPLEDNQTQSWLGWAATLASNAIGKIIPTDDESCYATDEHYESYNEDYYVEDEHGYLTPKWIRNLENIVAFKESKLGEIGTGIIGENVGMLIGAAFPEASMAYAAGKAAANNMVGESENKSMIVEGAGVAAALTATALSTGLSYLTGTPMEYGQALGYMVTAAGTIAGGMNGLEAVGKEVPEGYIPDRTVRLVATGAMGGVVKAAADILPGPLSTVTTVAGSLLKPVVVAAAFNAPEVASLADRIIHPMPQNLYDPGEFLNNVTKNAQGDSSALATSMATSLVESPLMLSITQLLLKQSIDKKLAMNAIVRAVNDFVKVIQDDGIQEKIRELKATPDEIKKDILKKEIAELIAKKYGLLEKVLAEYLQSKSASSAAYLTETIVDLISRKEKEMLGMELSDAKQTQALLEVLIPPLLPMIGVYLKREGFGQAKDLSPEEIETFYQNFNAMIFAPYNDYSIVRGVQGLISTAIPFMQKYAQFIPSLLSEKIGSSMVDPIITLDDDPEFDIPATTAQKVEEERKESRWESIRAKLSFFKSMIQLGRVKNFMKSVGDSIVNLIMRKAKKPMDSSGDISGTGQ